MVEDEFVAVAGDFTRHLHAAEYHRLKAEAKSKSRHVIDSIARPVTGEMTDDLKRKYKALGVARKQCQCLVRSEDDSDPENPGYAKPWAGTSLQGLMESPRKKAVSLTGLARSGSQSSRPSQGSPRRLCFQQRESIAGTQEASDSDDYDDDLDAKPTVTRRQRRHSFHKDWKMAATSTTPVNHLGSTIA